MEINQKQMEKLNEKLDAMIANFSFLKTECEKIASDCYKIKKWISTKPVGTIDYNKSVENLVLKTMQRYHKVKSSRLKYSYNKTLDELNFIPKGYIQQQVSAHSIFKKHNVPCNIMLDVTLNILIEKGLIFEIESEYLVSICNFKGRAFKLTKWDRADAAIDQQINAAVKKNNVECKLARDGYKVQPPTPLLQNFESDSTLKNLGENFENESPLINFKNEFEDKLIKSNEIYHFERMFKFNDFKYKITKCSEKASFKVNNANESYVTISDIEKECEFPLYVLNCGQSFTLEGYLEGIENETVKINLEKELELIKNTREREFFIYFHEDLNLTEIARIK